MSFTIGIDYGTNSVRAIVVDCSDGREVGSSVVNYPSGRYGVLLDPRDHHVARQHPGDYIFGLRNSVSIPENEAVYNRLYALYRQMHDAFGGVNRSADLSGVMKEFICIREEQTKA